jgi:hypothetical protein
MYVIICRLMRHVRNYIEVDVSACNYIEPPCNYGKITTNTKWS